MPGCLILGTLMGELRAERLDICKYGVREGYLECLIETEKLSK